MRNELKIVLTNFLYKLLKEILKIAFTFENELRRVVSEVRKLLLRFSLVA